MLPIRYNNQRSEIASYNYTDIAEGTGVVAFHAADLSGSNVLTQNTIYSLIGYTGINGGGTCTKTFDVTFNMPKAVKGQFKINIPVGIYSENANPTGAMMCSGSFNLLHYDGTTETSMTSGSYIWSANSLTNGTAEYYVLGFVKTLSLKTFKAGETLRLKSYFYSPSVASVIFFMGHDPKSRTNLGDDMLSAAGMAWTTTQQTAYVPFVLDI